MPDDVVPMWLVMCSATRSVSSADGSSTSDMSKLPRLWSERESTSVAQLLDDYVRHVVVRLVGGFRVTG